MKSGFAQFELVNDLQSKGYAIRYGVLTASISLMMTSVVSAQNAVVLGNAYLNGGHADGGIWVGGDIYGSNYELNTKGVSSNALYVGGDNRVTNFLRVLGSGNADVIGDLGKLHLNGGKLMELSEPDWASFVAMSSQLSSLGGVSFDTRDHNNLRVTLKQGEVNVFHLNSSDMWGLKTLDFYSENGSRLSGGEVVVINVSGDLSSWGWSVNYDASNVIWNFYDAETVNITQRSLQGALLAPNAAVYQTQSINGFLLAETWTVQNSASLKYLERPVISVLDETIGGIPSAGGGLSDQAGIGVSFPNVDHSLVISSSPIPEPSAMWLGGLAACFLLWRRSPRG